jgi:uncharacterized SAM-binding protein YcdF (DUF218 family)
MKTSRIIGDILLGLGAVFTVYLSVIMIRRINSVVLQSDYRKIFCYELAACAVFLLFAADVRFGFFTKPKPAALKVIGWLLRILVIAVTAVLLFFFGKICVGSCIRSDGAAQNVIVLGIALENGKPTDDLICRLDTAEQYLLEHPEASAILTGGNADDSGKTEAAVMRDILLARGIPEKQMILEDQADSTKANFRNAANLIDPNAPVVLISSNYHMDRAVQIARKAGFTDIQRLPAKSSAFKFGSNVMYEVILELNELTLKQ